MAKNTEIDEKISLEKQLQQDVSGGEGKVLLSVTDTFPFAKWANRFLKVSYYSRSCNNTTYSNICFHTVTFLLHH